MLNIRHVSLFFVMARETRDFSLVCCFFFFIISCTVTHDLGRIDSTCVLLILNILFSRTYFYFPFVFFLLFIFSSLSWYKVYIHTYIRHQWKIRRRREFDFILCQLSLLFYISFTLRSCFCMRAIDFAHFRVRKRRENPPRVSLYIHVLVYTAKAYYIRVCSSSI